MYCNIIGTKFNIWSVICMQHCSSPNSCTCRTKIHWPYQTCTGNLTCVQQDDSNKAIPIWYQDHNLVIMLCIHPLYSYKFIHLLKTNWHIVFFLFFLYLLVLYHHTCCSNRYNIITYSPASPQQQHYTVQHSNNDDNYLKYPSSNIQHM